VGRTLAGAVCVALAVVVSSASAAPSAAPPVSVVWAEPALNRTTIAVERVVGGAAGDADKWRMNLDVALRHVGTTREPLQVASIRIMYPGSQIPDLHSAPIEPDTIPAGGVEVIRIPESRDHAFPVAPQVSLRVFFKGYDAPVVVTRPLVEWKSKIAGGAYLFPGKREDLPDGWYWTDSQNHVLGSDHRASTTQRFGYDFSVRRWDGKQWTTVEEKGSSDVNADRLVWDMPVYAMADGWVLRCIRSVRDNPKPGVKGTAGGNIFWIVHAPGEVALYAHFQLGKTDEKLCPREGVNLRPNAIRVKAGQFLGRAGNSGQSSGPHVHVHLETTGLQKPAGQGIPLPFRRVRTRYAGEQFTDAPPCSSKNKPFAPVSRASTSKRQLVEPLYRGGHPEIARHGVTADCFQDLFEGITAAGYVPFWLDGYDVKGKPFLNALFRPGSVAWALKGGLTKSAFQNELEDWVEKGYRPAQVEAYREGGAVRYAFIAEKRSGPKYVAYHDRSASDHEELFAKYKREGYTPTNVAVVSVKGKRRYTALWEQRSLGAWQAESAMTSGDYQQWLTENARAGRHLVYLDAYVLGGKPRFSAIVTSKASKDYAARHDLSASGYQSEYAKWRGQGLLTEVVTGYERGGKAAFAGLWRK